MSRFIRIDLITCVWLLLALMTALSWALGTQEGAILQGGQSLASTALLLLACFKVRLVIIHFMEIKGAPLALRVICEAWVALVCTALIAIYLSGFGGHA